MHCQSKIKETCIKRTRAPPPPHSTPRHHATPFEEFCPIMLVAAEIASITHFTGHLNGWQPWLEAMTLLLLANGIWTPAHWVSQHSQTAVVHSLLLLSCNWSWNHRHQKLNMHVTHAWCHMWSLVGLLLSPQDSSELQKTRRGGERWWWWLRKISSLVIAMSFCDANK